MKEEDFKKAVKKDKMGKLIGMGFGLFIMLLGYSFYSIDNLLSMIALLIGFAFFMGTFVSMTETIEAKNYPEKYSLCKRCKRLIKKDKIFCLDCKDSIKRSLRRSEDTQYFDEYKRLIKQEEKKREKK